MPYRCCLLQRKTCVHLRIYADHAAAPTCRERNIQQIGTMYEKTFVTLTERFFKGVPWPPVELLAVLVDHDHVFCMLYKVRYVAS